MLYLLTGTMLLCVAIIGLLASGPVQAATLKEQGEKLSAYISKRSAKPLNRVSMIEINVYNLFQPQLIHQGHVGLASNRLSIVRLPSNYTKYPDQARLLSQYDVKEEIVSARDGDVVNQGEMVSKSELMMVRDASGDVHVVRIVPVAIKNDGQVLLFNVKPGER